MSADRMAAASAEADDRTLYRVGGLAALGIGIGYVVIIPIYLAVGAPPTGAEAWLTYLAGKTAPWWAILGLSVLTDLCSSRSRSRSTVPCGGSTATRWRWRPR